MVTGERVGTVVAEEKGILGREVWRERRRLDCDGESYREGNLVRGEESLYSRGRLRAKGRFKFSERI